MVKKSISRHRTYVSFGRFNRNAVVYFKILYSGHDKKHAVNQKYAMKIEPNHFTRVQPLWYIIKQFDDIAHVNRAIHISFSFIYNLHDKVINKITIILIYQIITQSKHYYPLIRIDMQCTRTCSKDSLISFNTFLHVSSCELVECVCVCVVKMAKSFKRQTIWRIDATIIVV